MALDNAQFMSELSITDPPGTDPLSEGDDQIRTSKRTQLQSFPNVDKAVTTTADELNDVALLSGANDFTAVNTFHNENLEVVADIADDNAALRYRDENGFLRWEVGRANTTTSGDWRLRRFDAAGAFQDNPIVVTELDGRARLSNRTIIDDSLDLNDPTSASARSLVFQQAESTRWQLNMTAGNTQLRIRRFDGSGIVIDNPFSILSTTGLIVMPTLPNTDPATSGGLYTKLSSAILAGDRIVIASG